MKLTKNELRTIIKEEIQKLSEAGGSHISLVQRKSDILVVFNSDKAKRFYENNYKKYKWPSPDKQEEPWTIAFDGGDEMLEKLEKFMNNKVRVGYEVVIRK